MRLALIPPTGLLADTFKTDYQLALAHLAVKDQRYFNHYQYMGGRGGQYVILDNGAFEGSLVNALRLIDIANNMQPQELVIPDAMRYMEMTQDRAVHFRAMTKYKLDPKIKLMFVIQGNSEKEFRQSARWASEQDWIDTIGIPKHTPITLDYRPGRLMLASYLRDVIVSNKPIHFLGGVANDVREHIAAKQQDIARGMDTSMPYVLGIERLSPWLTGVSEYTRQSGYFDIQMDADQMVYTGNNVNQMVQEVYDVEER